MKKDYIQLFILILFSKEIELFDIKPKFDKLITKIKNRLYISLLDKDNFRFFDKNKLNKDINNNNLGNFIGPIIMKALEYYWIKIYDIKYLFIKEDLLNATIEKSNNYFLELYSLLLDELYKNSIKNILIDKLNISEYLNINEVTEKVKLLNPDFNIQKRIYKFISLFDFLRDKIISQNFLDNLENNFGVCLDSEKFIEEVKNKNIDDKYIKDILKKYDLFSFEELYLLNYFNQKGYYFIENKIWKYYGRKGIVLDYFLFTILKNSKNIFAYINSKLIKKYFKVNKEKKKIKYKEELKRNNINIKISYDKINNKRTTKYINKKNVNRLLLFKRSHY